MDEIGLSFASNNIALTNTLIKSYPFASIDLVPLDQYSRLFSHIILTLPTLDNWQSIMTVELLQSHPQILNILRERAMLAQNCPGVYISSDATAYSLIKWITSMPNHDFIGLAPCISRLVQIWSDPVFAIHASSDRVWAICRNLCMIVSFVIDGDAIIGKKWMDDVGYWIQHPDAKRRAWGLCCVEVMASKSTGSAGLDFELREDVDVSLLRGYGTGRIATVGSKDEVPKRKSVAMPPTPIDSDDEDEEDFQPYNIVNPKPSNLPRRLHDYISVLKSPSPDTLLEYLEKLASLIKVSSSAERESVVYPLLFALLRGVDTSIVGDDMIQRVTDARIECLKACASVNHACIPDLLREFWGEKSVGIRLECLRVLGGVFADQQGEVGQALPPPHSQGLVRIGKVTRVSRRVGMTELASVPNQLGGVGEIVLRGLLYGGRIEGGSEMDAAIIDALMRVCAVVVWGCRSCLQGLGMADELFLYVCFRAKGAMGLGTCGGLLSATEVAVNGSSDHVFLGGVETLLELVGDIGISGDVGTRVGVKRLMGAIRARIGESC